ncbi:MAG: putative peptidase [Burkholderiaceae bacterium]|nr:putative peptidase [Burkholderiaceae bacterium]
MMPEEPLPFRAVHGRFRACCNTIRRPLRAAILLLACLACAAQAAPRATDRSKQKAAAEAQRADLRQQLDSLKREITKTESAKDSVADTLAASEAAISNANRSLRELAGEQQQTEARIRLLSAEHARLTVSVADQQQRLSKLLRDQYVTGNENRLKLLLSGDNPNRINRELQYMGYVSQAQAAMIAQLRASLKAVEENREATQNAKEELDEIAQEKLAQKNVLEKEKSRRATLLSQLSNKLTAQRKEAGRLQRDQQRLAGLVDRLTRLIAEQKKAAAAKRRQPVARPSKSPTRTNRASEPALENRAEPAHEPDAQDGVFAGLRGKLRLPVRGSITSKFGSKREDGPGAKGLFIRTAEGAEIRAVAAGKVVFADWLRGFGNLIIVDHGSQYMTIYGNNQALLKHAGDTVRGGDVIASAGNSGGSEHSGLYFEMRHRGRAFDPLGWVTIR